MMRVHLQLWVCLAAWCLPLAGLAQTVDEDNSELLSSRRRQAAAESDVNFERAAQLIIEQTNDFRTNQDREAVEQSSSLMSTARSFAEYMARTDKYGHTADGQRPVERAKNHDYEPCIIAENIAWQYDSTGFTTRDLATKFVQGWEHSPEHRKNMLDEDVVETGVGVAHSDETDHYYAVQMFGRPKSMAIEVRIANRTTTEVEYELGGDSFWLPGSFIRTHERCRPAELVFHLQENTPENTARTYMIRQDAEFTITRGAFGDVEIQRSPTGTRLGFFKGSAADEGR